MTDADTLLRDYGNLARGIARRYRGRGLPLEDLHQEALLGLLQAAKSYRDRGASFATYAVYWIKKRILGPGTGRHHLPGLRVPAGEKF